MQFLIDVYNAILMSNLFPRSGLLPQVTLTIMEELDISTMLLIS